MKEIGSEFWTKHQAAYPNNKINEVFLLSGRTALRFIIDDICKTRSFRKVLLPSYCCESMIEPFVSVGIETQFYDVYADHVDYPYKTDADAVLLIDFFGYANPQNEKISRREKEAGKVIIYDATHKIDGNPAVSVYTDYSFCSYRKWFYCNFAQVIKYNGKFNSNDLSSNDQYVEIRDKAAHEKEKYFAGLTSGKEEFLSLFSFAEQILDDDYIGYAGSPVTFDVHKIVSKRRENAAYLINELKNIPEIRLWRDKLSASDVPLFVPILMDPLIRNKLRCALIKENIYCPIHWPKSPYHRKYNDLYDMELSLICDQRYDATDMERMVGAIKRILSR